MVPVIRKRWAKAGYLTADEFRELAVTNALYGHISIPELAGIFGIGQSTLYRWAAESRRKVSLARHAPRSRGEVEQIDLIRRERDAFKIVALSLARELARDR